MLAIVIPTILATLGVAFWFRASNKRARYLPDFEYSGRLEMLVWSIPAMTVLLVGGVAWVGSHDLDPRKPIASTVKPVRVQVVSLDWKWLFIYPEQGDRERQSTDHPGRHAGQLRADLLGRDEQLLRAAARQPDLHHGRNGDAPSPAGRPSWNLPRDCRPIQRRRFFRHALRRRCRAGREIRAVGGTQRAAPVRCSTRKTYADLAKPSEAVAPFTYRAVAPDLFNGIVSAGHAAGDPLCRTYLDVTEGRKMNLLGKLSWSAIPFDQPIIMGASAGMVLAMRLVLGVGHRQGILALSVARVDHLRRPQAHRRHVYRAGAGHAAARLRRRDHDARAAGGRRRRRAGISAAGAFRPDLLGARHDHDLLHGDAVRDRDDEFRGAAAARRPRHGVSDLELGEPCG